MKQRLEKAIGVLHSSWKFKHFCGDSMIKELLHSVWVAHRHNIQTSLIFCSRFALSLHHVLYVKSKEYGTANITIQSGATPAVGYDVFCKDS